MAKSPIGYRRILRVLLDLGVIAFSYSLASVLRFDFRVSPEHAAEILHDFPLAVGAYTAAFLILRPYLGFARYWGIEDFVTLLKSVAAGAVASVVAVLFFGTSPIPVSTFIAMPAFVFIGALGVRYLLRLARLRFDIPTGGETRRVLIVGAGDIGESLLRQFLKSKTTRYEVVGFLDDMPAKRRMTIHGVPVLGGRGLLSGILASQALHEVVIAISTRRGDIVRFVKETLDTSKKQIELRIAPSLDQMLSAPRSGEPVHNLKPADLLNRDQIHLDDPEVDRLLRGKTVLVTGAGGTIGGELCRQILRCSPGDLVLIENHATSLFFTELELRRLAPDAKVTPVLGSICDRALVRRVFRDHRPDVVFHAAAHKHQPQLETNVHEGVKNNILGTYWLCEAAAEVRSDSFVLISTDKAVHPSGVMGATKRFAERIIQAFGEKSATRFCTVRFGNVLGSSGSVLEIFRQQIARGGPLTITDPGVERYFMTVEEAASLILHANLFGKDGELFLLKMGRPVKILDLALNILNLHGLEPGRDIRIENTGLRDGEKLREELHESSETVTDSRHPDILVVHSPSKDLISVEVHIERFLKIADSPEADIIAALREAVPSYLPQNSPHAIAEKQVRGAS